LIERLSVDDQTIRPFRIVDDDVGRPEVIPLERLLPEEITFSERPDVLLLVRVLHLLRHLDGALADDEEGVASGALSDDVVPVGVERLFQHVGYLDEGVFWQVLEDGHALQEVGVLGLSDQAGPHHDGLEALSLDGPQFAIGRRFDGSCSLTMVQDG
jgi:hypothetical protein